MGCSRKAYYEELIDARYEEKLKKVDTLSKKEIFDIFEKIREEVNFMQKITVSASRDTYASLDRLTSILKEVL